MRKTALLLALLACMHLVSAASYRDVLPDLSEEEYARLESGQTVEYDSTDGDDIRLLAPQGGMAWTMADEYMNTPNSFSVGLDALVPYPESWKEMDDGEKQLAIFNDLRKISTLQGLTYISHRAGDKEKVLFNRTYSLTDPDDRSTKYDDPVVEELPQELLAYAYLNDTTFDGQIYELQYRTGPEEVYLTLTNYRPLRFKGIKVLDGRQLKLAISTWLTDEGILVTTSANIADHKPKVHILWWDVSLPGAFKRRTRSLRLWFQALVDGTRG